MSNPHLKMVFIDTKETHCPDLLKEVNNLRKDEALCDAYLIVNDKKVPAHRCMLVAESDYFKSRFLGPFKEDVPGVDLSSVTDDCVSVEHVVNFLYTGQININQENLESLLKISSFLLSTKLHQHCIDFMEKTLSSDTTVKYYLLSVNLMLGDQEDYLKETVRTRFHDWLIHDKSSLEIPPEQLEFLMKECDSFEFCTRAEILEFVMVWDDVSKTEAYESLGSEILDLVISKKTASAIWKKSEEESAVLEKIRKKTEAEKNNTLFMKKIERYTCIYSIC